MTDNNSDEGAADVCISCRGAGNTAERLTPAERRLFRKPPRDGRQHDGGDAANDNHDDEGELVMIPCSCVRPESTGTRIHSVCLYRWAAVKEFALDDVQCPRGCGKTLEYRAEGVRAYTELDEIVSALPDSDSAQKAFASLRYYANAVLLVAIYTTLHVTGVSDCVGHWLSFTLTVPIFLMYTAYSGFVRKGGIALLDVLYRVLSVTILGHGRIGAKLLRQNDASAWFQGILVMSYTVCSLRSFENTLVGGVSVVFAWLLADSSVFGGNTALFVILRLLFVAVAALMTTLAVQGIALFASVVCGITYLQIRASRRPAVIAFTGWKSAAPSSPLVPETHERQAASLSPPTSAIRRSAASPSRQRKVAH